MLCRTRVASHLPMRATCGREGAFLLERIANQTVNLEPTHDHSRSRRSNSTCRVPKSRLQNGSLAATRAGRRTPFDSMHGAGLPEAQGVSNQRGGKSCPAQRLGFHGNAGTGPRLKISLRVERAQLFEDCCPDCDRRRSRGRCCRVRMDGRLVHTQPLDSESVSRGV
jgi:hypothetical protein